MSGHSHAKTVMATKMANAAKRGKIFSKFGKLITIAAKDGGEPSINSKLKAAIDRAKSFNMPKDNIEKAIKRGTGELASEKLEEVSYEGFGPGGMAMIIDCITDNTNRALTSVKTTLNQNGGKMAGEGAVRWMFNKKGVISVKTEGASAEELELLAIELGADDVNLHEGALNIYTKPEDLEKIKKSLEKKQIKIEDSSLDYIAKEEVELSEKDKAVAQKLFEALNENDDVSDIYSNIKN